MRVGTPRKRERQQMLSLFRKILSKSAAPQAVPPASSAPVARHATLPPPLPRPVARAPIPVRVTPVAPKVVATQPAPQPAQSVQSRPVEPPPATDAHVQIALSAIAAGLPEAISHKVSANPAQFVAV